MDFIISLLLLGGCINFLRIKDRFNKVVIVKLIFIIEIRAVIKVFV